MNSINKTHYLALRLKNCSRFDLKRYLNTHCEQITKQCELFTKEQNRQKEAVGRIEKMEVLYDGQPESSTLTMNKNVSTPHDCAKHIGDKIVQRSVVALLDKKTLWHMHKPIPESCTLEFLHYHMPNPSVVNKVFWRTCSFLLGAVASDSFKSGIEFHLHSFPSPSVRSGSFLYDIQLGLADWKPTKSELKVLSIDFIKFCQHNYPIEYLDVSKELALEMFQSNPHKSQQIPDIAAHNGDKVTLFRAGPHIDISRGPMLPNTDHLGRITVTNVIKLDTDIPGSPIYRFQGVALPKAITLNHFAYGLIEDRGRSLNSGRIPCSQEVLTEENSFMAHVAQ